MKKLLIAVLMVCVIIASACTSDTDKCEEEVLGIVDVQNKQHKKKFKQPKEKINTIEGDDCS